MTRRLVPAAVVTLATLLAVAPAVEAAPRLRLGFDDDTLKWRVKPNSIVAIQRHLGAPYTRITIPWRRGEVRPRPVVETYLRRAARAGELHQKVLIAVYNGADQAPTDVASRDQYCRYARALVKRLPRLSAIVVWNEANSPRYWPPAAGAPAYEALLARCWDVLHGYRKNVNVIDSTASHYRPAAFIEALGTAYRASGRARPIVDTFGHNPYPESASEDPWATHQDTGSIGEGDYATLLAALTRAFQFTAQRVPGPTWTRLWYLEDGFQSSVPWLLQPSYYGHENDVTALPTGGDGKTQPAQLRAAISLAYCQPAVGALFNFELMDEHRLGGWQSGVMFANGQPKPSFSVYREIASEVSHGTIDCATVKGAPAPAGGTATSGSSASSP